VCGLCEHSDAKKLILEQKRLNGGEMVGVLREEMLTILTKIEIEENQPNDQGPEEKSEGPRNTH
jgi:hypothetical protein